MKIKHYYLTIIFLLIVLHTQGQNKEFGKTSLIYGIGIGETEDGTIGGFGGLFLCGVNQDLGYKNRFRLSLLLNLGSYNTKAQDGGYDQAFHSICLGPKVYADVIRYRSISLVLGTGFALNNMAGYIRDGVRGLTHNSFFNVYNIAAYLGTGIRVNPPNSRLAFELLPLNFYFSGINADDFFQSDLRFSTIIRLSK
jgi:hypothetical protein